MFASFRTIAFTLLSFLLFNVAGVPTAPVSDSSVSLGGLTIGEIINLLGVGLVGTINTEITLESLEDNLVSINFTVKNPLIIELTIDSITSTAGLNGTVFATFNHTFATPLVVPILGSANSGTINNVFLPQGAEATLNIVPFGVLDLLDTNANVRAGTIFGLGGVPIAIDGLVQDNVPTTYTLELTD